MSFEQFPEYIFETIFNSSEELPICSHSYPISFEIGNLMVGIYVQGILSGTEKIRIKFYDTNGFLYFTSDWSEFVDSNSIGLIKIDFNREVIQKNKTYNLTMEMSGYSRNTESFYIAYLHDFGFDTYGVNSNGYSCPIRSEVYGWIV